MTDAEGLQHQKAHREESAQVERSWVDELTEQGWEVEYFYYGQMEGDLWRHRGDDYQREFGFGIREFAENPDPDAPAVQLEIERILSRYGQDTQELRLTWHDRTDTHAPAAWVQGWKRSTEAEYLRSKRDGGFKPNGDYSVPALFTEPREYSHSRPLEGPADSELQGTDR